MEDDDEFGDLYSDVLHPFSSTTTMSSAAPQPHYPFPPPPHLHHPIDLNRGSAPAPMFLDSKHEPADGQDVNFDIEEGGSNGIEATRYDDPIFPGLTEPVPHEESGWNANESGIGIRGGEAEADEGDGCDSDNANQGTEEHEWGEEGCQAADGEKKEGGEAAKVGTACGGGGSVVAPKIGYSDHGYHPFHSQFKYLRPGAASMPGTIASGPGSAPAQVRPIMSVTAGCGRGDWRPHGMKTGTPMQKGFHPSFGMPGGVNNMAGRGGLEFTLPSHKTNFLLTLVDSRTIFNVDIDSFEDKPWKHSGVDLSDFFNFGLNEEGWKDYCKQLEQHRLETTMQSKIRVYESGRTEQGYDPDLPPELAAATGQEVRAGAANLGKLDGGQNDVTKGTARIRPPLPTGRAIQVEGGCGERLPSIDTRPPRLRDLDAIIESNVPEDDKILPFPAEALRPDGPGSRGQSPMHPSGNFEVPPEERQRRGRAGEISPHETRIQGKQDKFSDGHEEESVESMDGKSPFLVRDAREISVERMDGVDDELEPTDGSPVEKELLNGTYKDGSSLNPLNNGKNRFQLEQRKLHNADDGEDSRAARSSEHSKTRSGSSRDYQKRPESAEEEVVQGGHSSRVGNVRKNLDEHDHSSQRKYCDGRLEIERNRMTGTPGEDSYPLRDFDANLSDDFPIKTEGFDRRRECDNTDGTWQWGEDDLYSRKNRSEDFKRGHDDEMGSRNRTKVRGNERTERDGYPPSRKQFVNGSYKVHRDKDVSTRLRERDDNLKSRYHAADDYHNKRRKDEDYLRRVNADKEEILHGQRESSSRCKKQERDEILDQRKRDEQQRIRDNFDEHHSVRHKGEVWLHRERVEKRMERDEWHKLKQSHDKSLSKQEKEVRGTVRSGCGLEDKAWVGHTREKDEHRVSEKEYQLKEAVRNSEQVKRRDRNDDEGYSHHRGHEDPYSQGHQFSNDEIKSRQERSSTRSDHAVNGSDSRRGHEKKRKENVWKTRESEGGGPITFGSAKRSNEDLSGLNNETGLKSAEKSENPVYNSPRKHREDASSDGEQQELKRGPSKLERWTSHEKRDYNINSKSSTSSKLKEIENINNVGSSGSYKISDESSKSIEPAENHHSVSDDNGVCELEIRDADTRPSDTVEKLKKRSERMESEAMPSAKTERTPSDSDIKQERPARKMKVGVAAQILQLWKPQRFGYTIYFEMVTIRDPGIGMNQALKKKLVLPSNEHMRCFTFATMACEDTWRRWMNGWYY
ncbi:hypothetical protein GOBAR_AA33449 [Gossypium barbadense]|uniref:Pre-mRNA polyadenylation factor Fip1 domain-containing protein n=1 Tax=Gossypium barbadense TaxID=3634 RepID=A0A2P5W857_GOSBA|nr:hypothetical protein GOBAR_AA33449 [Gossypium barbadense]